MKQTGKFHVYEIKDDKRVVSAIANATLYFLDVNNQEQFKLTTKTDNEGNFNFDLAVGEYVVLATAGDGLEQVLANGSTFKLTAQSKVNAFEEWLNNPSENADSSLLAKFRELMQRTESAAERGEQAAVTVDQNLEVNLQKLSDRTNAGLSSLTIEKNNSIQEIRTTKDNSLVELKTATDKADGIKQDINNAETSAVASVNSAKSTSLTEINTAKTNAVSAVNTAKNSSVQAVTDTKNNAISEVNATKDTAIEEVEAKVPDFTADLNKKWDVQQTIGNGAILRQGIAGLAGSGRVPRSPTFQDGRPPEGNGFYSWGSVAEAGYGSGFSLLNGSNLTNLSVGLTSPNVYVRSYAVVNGASYGYKYHLYGSSNTTIDTNGFLKKASPVIDLYANHIEHNDQFDEEPIFEKLGIGYYKISGTLGLAKGIEAGDWYIETPKDKNGERYFNTEWQQLEDNTVIIRTYEREAFTEEYERYDENGEVLKDPNGNPLKFFKRHDINGKPIDITENRFISLRFYEEPKEHEAPEMPEESEEDRKAREEQQAIEVREQEIAELKRNRTLKSNEALVMKDIDESVYLELIEEVKEINARLKSFKNTP